MYINTLPPLEAAGYSRSAGRANIQAVSFPWYTGEESIVQVRHAWGKS